LPLSPAVLAEVERILGPRGVISTPEGRLAYECDMHTFYKGAPDVVALPETTEQVVELLRLCRREHLAVVPRGSGTGLMAAPWRPSAASWSP